MESVRTKMDTAEDSINCWSFSQTVIKKNNLENLLKHSWNPLPENLILQFWRGVKVMLLSVLINHSQTNTGLSNSSFLNGFLWRRFEKTLQKFDLSHMHHACAILKTRKTQKVEMFHFEISEISQLSVRYRQEFLSMTGLHFQVIKHKAYCTFSEISLNTIE